MRWPDRMLELGLVSAVFVFAALWPRDLYLFDEGVFLYEATRLLHGAVFYRDFFEISAPLSFYVLAGAFALFGVRLVVARALMAGVHAAIAVLVYGTARSLGVRRGLAFVAGLTHLALAYVALPLASPHWFGTALIALLVRVALSPGGRQRTGWLGLIVGLLLATQHQRGTALAAGVVAMIALDSALAGWAGAPAPRLWPALARFAAGVAAVVVPVYGALLATSGPGPMYDGLVRLPLNGYRAYHRDKTWGWHQRFPYGDIPARVTDWLPWFFPLTLLSGLRAVLRGVDPQGTRDRIALAVLGGFAVLSIAYNPDTIHLAFVAPVALIAAAERLEAALRTGERYRRTRRASPLVIGALTASLSVLLGLELQVRWAAYPVRADTPIGPVDFIGPSEPQLLEALRQHLHDEPTPEVFGYPFYASLYLLVGAPNATRFQVLKPGYSAPEHIAEALRTLETRRTPYVVALPFWVDWNNDEVIRYLDAHYERVLIPGLSPMGGFALFHRRP